MFPWDTVFYQSKLKIWIEPHPKTIFWKIEAQGCNNADTVYKIVFQEPDKLICNMYLGKYRLNAEKVYLYL